MAFCNKCGGIVDVVRKVCRECGVTTNGSKPLITEGEEEFTREGPLVIERAKPAASATVSAAKPAAAAVAQRPKGVVVSKDLGPPPPGVVVKDGRAYSTFKNGPGGTGATKLCCGEIVTGRFCAQCGKNQA